MTKINLEKFAQLYYFFPRIMFGGTDWGEIIDVCPHLDASIKTKPLLFWNQWFNAWKRHGDKLARQSNDYSKVVASHFLLKAAAAYHWAEFMFFQDTSKKEECRHMVSNIFRQAQTNLLQEIEIVEFSYQGINLPGYLLHAVSHGKQPTIILINGLDSAKEVELYRFSSYFLAQGISCLIFDAPGQGVLLETSAMELQFESVMTDILAQLVNHKRVDSDRLGIFGVSFGGYLALRCLASHPVLKAAINLSGAYDLSNYRNISTRIRHDFCYVFKINSDDEMAKLVEQQLSLANLASPQGDILCIHGGNDIVFPIDNCQKIKRWATPEKTEVFFYPEEGHVCQNYFFDFMPKAARWMTSRLKK